MNVARPLFDAGARKGFPIRTFTGRQFWPLDPRVEDFDINDIAHSLSNQCRFGGAVRKFYSVAEHCVRVSWACSKEDELCGLLHDAHEAYLLDLPRPVRKMLPEYEVWAKEIDRVLALHLGIPQEKFYTPGVVLADETLLATEARDLMTGSVECSAEPLKSTIQPWKPSMAEAKWLALFRTLIHPEYLKMLKGGSR